MKSSLIQIIYTSVSTNTNNCFDNLDSHLKNNIYPFMLVTLWRGRWNVYKS